MSPGCQKGRRFVGARRRRVISAKNGAGLVAREKSGAACVHSGIYGWSLGCCWTAEESVRQRRRARGLLTRCCARGGAQACAWALVCLRQG